MFPQQSKVWFISMAGMGSEEVPTTTAGTPATVLWGATSLRTTLPALREVSERTTPVNSGPPVAAVVDEGGGASGDEDGDGAVGDGTVRANEGRPHAATIRAATATIIRGIRFILPPGSGKATARGASSCGLRER